jgi:hypothetical protein
MTLKIQHLRTLRICLTQNLSFTLSNALHISKTPKSQKVLCNPCIANCSFLSVTVGWGSWFEHVKGWWEMRDRYQILFLFYEDIKRVSKKPCQTQAEKPEAIAGLTSWREGGLK